MCHAEMSTLFRDTILIWSRFIPWEEVGRQPGSEIWEKEEKSELELQSEQRNFER